MKQYNINENQHKTQIIIFAFCCTHLYILMLSYVGIYVYEIKEYKIYKLLHNIMCV